jgi:glycerol kinase
MPDCVLALDIGTSSTRCVVLGKNYEVYAIGSSPLELSYPKPGWVEQDPEQLANGTVEAVKKAIKEAGVSWDEVKGIGISNQTETFIVWNRKTGKPVWPAIVWQCKRTAAACDALREAGKEPFIRERTGLELDPAFSATKVRWLFENVEGVEAAARAGDLAFGDVGSWLVWRLSGEKTHVTEPSNACRSMLVNLHTLDWDDELIALFDIPKTMLPPIQPSGSILGYTDPDLVGGRAPISSVLGDQQAALFGQQCWSAGQAKVTLGTGAFIWANAGHTPPSPPDGIVASCAWQTETETNYAFEGFIPVAGAAVNWLIENRILTTPAESEELIMSLDQSEADNTSVWCLPAFAGTGSPTWNANTRGTFVGIDLSTRPAHLVRATLDGIAHQLADAFEVMKPSFTGGRNELRMDGGLARNNWMLQRIADLTGSAVERPTNLEATAIGTASLAGLTVGFWKSRDELVRLWTMEQVRQPQMSAELRKRLRERWKKLVDISNKWDPVE